jgi:hypothetical protein
MCKSEEDMEDAVKVTMGVEFSSMYLFGADTVRLPFDDKARAAVSAVFGGPSK